MRSAEIVGLQGFTSLIPADVFEVIFNETGLRVRVEPEDDGLTIAFDDLIGFRLLDEGDLLEFWGDTERLIGWVYEVKSGGWLELESSRSGFLSTDRGLLEYLVATQNTCLSVLAFNSPTMVQDR